MLLKRMAPEAQKKLGSLFLILGQSGFVLMVLMNHFVPGEAPWVEFSKGFLSGFSIVCNLAGIFWTGSGYGRCWRREG